MNSLSKDILKDLECPVCMEYMSSPIIMCENKHNICDNCRQILHKCPSCRQPFLHTRNTTLETLAREVQHPCVYQNYGCRNSHFRDQISEHQAECPYGPHKCPFSKVASHSCKWESPLLGIKHHIVSEHAKDVCKVSGKQTIICTSYTYCQAICTLGEVFMYFSKVRSGIFYACILYVGSKESAKKFRYRATFVSTDRQESASICLITRGYMEDIDDIFKSGNCVLFHYNFIKNCTRVFKGLPVEVEISMVES